MTNPGSGIDEGRVSDEQRGTGARGLRRDAPTGISPNIPLTRTSMSTAAPTELRPSPRQPWIRRKVDLFRLAGTVRDPLTELAAASKIWAQCHIALEPASLTVFDETQTRRLLAAEDGNPLKDLTVVVNPDEPSLAQRNLRQEWLHRRQGALAVVFAPNVRLLPTSARSAADPEYDLVYIGIQQYSPGWEVAHEIGHRLIGANIPHYALDSSLMHPNSAGDEIVELECRAARGDATARYQIMQGAERR
jgi:hypothetical protein